MIISHPLLFFMDTDHYTTLDDLLHKTQSKVKQVNGTVVIEREDQIFLYSNVQELHDSLKDGGMIFYQFIDNEFIKSFTYP